LTQAPAAEPRAETPSGRLRWQIARAVGPYAKACTALVNHPQLAELWPEYLLLQHAIIRATVPLTEAAAESTRALPESDPLRAPLFEYLEEHVDEELHHDERLLEDLELLGVRREDALAQMPSPAVATLVGCQYYWLRHHHPLAFLGYVALMEGYPPTEELIATLRSRTGYPAGAFRTFAEHGELDPGHRDHLDATLDAMPLTDQHEAVLACSALTTVDLAARALEELLEAKR
jgi:hypothetical protein